MSRRRVLGRIVRAAPVDLARVYCRFEGMYVTELLMVTRQGFRLPTEAERYTILRRAPWLLSHHGLFVDRLRGWH